MINCKTYDQASGNDAEDLAEITAQVIAESGKNVSLCPQAADIFRCSTKNIPILAQHCDSEPAGSHTGKLTIKSLKENGARGSLLNHSENRIPAERIKELITQLRDADMMSVVCVKDVDEASTYASYNPDMIAIEPPELIGGDISVTSANPAIVSDAVRAVHAVSPDIPVLCGAGVKNGGDVAKALELGAAGVLIASGVAKAADKKAALHDLVAGL